MRYLLFLTCFFIVCLNVFGQHFYYNRNQNDIQNSGLKGKVKNLKEYTNNLGSPDDTLNINTYKIETETFYNKQGYRIKDIFYSHLHKIKDSVYRTHSYTYNTQNRRVLSIEQPGNDTSRAIFSYNSKHMLIATYPPDKILPFYSARMVYNDKGLPDTFLTYNKGKLDDRRLFYYYKNDEKIKEVRFEKEKLASITFRYYNKSHSLIEIIAVGQKDIRQFHEILKYDKRGNEVVKIDSNLTFLDGRSHFTKKDNNQGVHIYTYRYSSFDNVGNWTRRDEFIDNKLLCVIKRDIKYYN